jgi:DNA repair protein RecO
MYHKHHTRGIVIGGSSEGDHSRRVDLLTEKFGLVSAKIQGARGSLSKMRPGTQDFSYGEFSLIHGKSGWKIVSVGAIANFFEDFRLSEIKLRVAQNVLFLVRRLIAEDESGGEVFEIVINFLDFLKGAKREEVPLSECLTLLKILSALGYMRHSPNLLIPISKNRIEVMDLEAIAPHRAQIVALINESLKSA